MSNRRRLPGPRVPDEIRATAKAARCSDCPAAARVRFLGGDWEIRLMHSPDCPAFRGATSGLHADAAASVARAAGSTGRRLGYTRVDDVRGEVTGCVTTGAEN